MRHRDRVSNAITRGRNGCYQAGRTACIDGKTIRACPYKPFTPQRDLWLEGFRDAAKDYGT